MSDKDEFASRIIRGSRADREAARKATKEKYARIKAEQEAEHKRIAEMLANMTEEERKEYWAKARKSIQGLPENIFH